MLKGWTSMIVEEATLVAAVQHFFDEGLFRYGHSPKVLRVDPLPDNIGKFKIICKEPEATNQLEQES